MTVQVITEAEIIRDVSQILLDQLNPAKVARFWASWQIGQGDYLSWRDEEFGEKTVETLYEEVLAFQQNPPQTASAEHLG